MLFRSLSEQRYDLGLSETTQAPTGVALLTLPQVNEVAVLPPRHRLARKTVLQPSDFEGERFISLAPGDPYRQDIDQMFGQASVQRNTCLETTSAVAICAMVRQGLGVAIVNPLTALELAGPSLLVRPLSVAIPFTVSLLLPQVAPPHPWREQLVAAVVDTARDLGRALALGTASK